ncbi:uncharacterized protein LOC127243740 [Andrographis paniculata]|uniref:uncharacterized protein LOC127243740 n=1 Tax=Andrographis paniculata TaxID=175694 RepID=UPI0021E6FA85|nr:uncharacterized protein LOC127243740 [Andrographis paniculata]
MASESKTADSNPPESALYDLPPESFWVSTADEQDWFNRYAVMQRKASLKLGFNRNSKSFPHRSDAALSNKRSSAARPSVLGLAAAARKSFGTDGRNAPEKKSSRPFFRSRSEPGAAKPLVSQLSDPGSPRVSCTGRIGTRSRGGTNTGFSRLFGSLFGSGKNRPRKGSAR